jgi:hypothetical protein
MHREDVFYVEQDMVNWYVKVFEILLPLLALLLETLKACPVIRMDETTVQVMGEEDRKGGRQSRARTLRVRAPAILVTTRWTVTIYRRADLSHHSRKRPFHTEGKGRKCLWRRPCPAQIL